MRLALGEVFAERFEVERLAGMGGMGAVYRAVDRLTGRPAALKILPEQDRSSIERFSREARLLADLRHPNIVGYVAHGITPQGALYLAMEWLDGEDLARYLARRPLTILETVTLAQQVAAALAAAHARGIIHRDIKPSNIFLQGSVVEEVRIIDFGVARAQASTRAYTRTGVMVGTPGYMAPEQARGARGVDGRADIFSLGCVLFECLAGRPAFSGENVMALLAKILLEEPPHLRDLQQNIPVELDALVASMLAKDPAERPADADSVLRELKSLDLAAVASLGPQTPRISRTLTSSERRLLCVIFVLPPEGTINQGVAETMATDAPPLSAAESTPKPPRQPDVQFLETMASTGVETQQLLAAITSVDSTNHLLAQRLRAATARFGARVDNLVNGSVLVTLTGRSTATDHVVQAARCAMEIQKVTPERAMLLVTGRGTLETSLPVGEVLDRAARLLSLAITDPSYLTRTPRPIWLDELSAGLVQGQFEVSGTGTLRELRGEHMGTVERKVLGRPVRLVGRDRELRMLADVLDECISDETARAVVVTAPPGVGKSRLRHEFVHRAKRNFPALEVWLSQGDSMSAGSPFGLVIQGVKHAAELRDSDSLAERQQALRKRVQRSVTPKDVPRITELLAELVGAPLGEEASAQLVGARQDPLLLGDQMRRAWEDWISAECSKHPVLIVLEDLQWGDLPSVKFFDAALRRLREQPFALVAFGRPETENLFPRLWQERDVQEIRLRPLNAKASEQLVRDVLGDEADAELVRRLVEHAAGNPFYLEELLRATAEHRDGALPETVLAMVQSRLEQMEPELRRAMRAASVFGQVFWRSAIAQLLGSSTSENETREVLTELVEREVLENRDNERFAGEEEYGFRHALVREAAYAMLTEDDRALAHRIAGEWLIGKGEQDSVLLAEHFERGGDPQRAVEHYLKAGSQALEGSDFAAAIARARRGLTCGATGEARGLLRLVEGESNIWRLEFADAEAAAADAISLLTPGSGPWYLAAVGIIITSTYSGNPARIFEVISQMTSHPLDGTLAPPHVFAHFVLIGMLYSGGQRDMGNFLVDRVVGATHQIPSDDLTAQAWFELVQFDRAAYVTRSPLLMQHHTNRSLAALEAVGDVRNLVSGRVWASWSEIALGNFERAEGLLKTALADSERMGVVWAVHFCNFFFALLYATQRRFAEAKVAAQAVIDNAREQKSVINEGLGHTRLAAALFGAGELDAAVAEVRMGDEMLQIIPAYWVESLAIHARILTALGRPAESLPLAEQAHSMLGMISAVEFGENTIHLSLAEALHANGNLDRAKEIIGQERARLMGYVTAIEDAAQRERFLGIPQHAYTLELAAKWLAV